jgi:hypothetical protein
MAHIAAEQDLKDMRMSPRIHKQRHILHTNFIYFIHINTSLFTAGRFFCLGHVPDMCFIFKSDFLSCTLRIFFTRTEWIYDIL